MKLTIAILLCVRCGPGPLKKKNPILYIYLYYYYYYNTTWLSVIVIITICHFTCARGLSHPSDRNSLRTHIKILLLYSRETKIISLHTRYNPFFFLRNPWSSIHFTNINNITFLSLLNFYTLVVSDKLKRYMIKTFYTN